VVIIGVGIVFSLKCFPLGIVLITEFPTLLWECLSALSVVTFTADLLLQDNYKLINLQKQEVDMNNKIKFQSSGVNMG
jgi:hypothetical protein